MGERVLLADRDDPVVAHLATFLDWNGAPREARRDFVAFFDQTGDADTAVELASWFDGRFEVRFLCPGADWSDATVRR